MYPLEEYLMENSGVGPAFKLCYHMVMTIQFLNKLFTLVEPPASLFEILWRRDHLENGENEIDNTDEAREGEHCYVCDEMLRTGWKASKHLDGRYLLLEI